MDIGSTKLTHALLQVLATSLQYAVIFPTLDSRSHAHL